MIINIDKPFHEIEHEAWIQRAGEYDSIFAPISTQAIEGILASLGTLKGKRLLDAACGTGHLTAAASEHGAISEGIDFAHTMVAIARLNYPGERFQDADATNLPFDDCSFEAVTCCFGLSHMENPQRAVREAFRVLKPGGHYAFTLWYGADDGNEAQAIVQDALARFATTPFILPEEWTILRYANKMDCQTITKQAGFGAPVFKKLPIVLRTKSALEVSAIIAKISVRTKMVLDCQPPDIRQRILESVCASAETHRAKGMISLKWPALLTVVQKPN
jgi:ubiquinone/menaquinone biosynthesis C-methylase UbiE